jgi:hypothetical protein
MPVGENDMLIIKILYSIVMNSLGGVVICALVSGPLGRRFDPLSVQTKDIKLVSAVFH